MLIRERTPAGWPASLRFREFHFKVLFCLSLNPKCYDVQAMSTDGTDDEIISEI